MDKRYDHATSEQEAQQLWGQKEVYHFDPNSKKEVYSIDTPPPTVSGALHIGHIFSYTHTDIIARYKRMKGFNVFYPMGFDDNGLPTERFVEKTHKTKAHLHKRSDFIGLCLKESETIEKVFEDLWKKMGLSIDWRATYSTISDDVRNTSQYSFLELHKKKHVYQKEEPAPYCPTCRTSVAQAELDSATFKSTFNDITFTTEDGTPLTIATTRPELLGACVSVFFHPDDERYAHLSGKHAITPIYGKKVPIIADDMVEKDKGSGLVMCCTFGDQTDIAWQKKHDLPMINLINRDGTWSEASGDLCGMRVHEARKAILQKLEECGALLKQEKISHAVSVHERCKTETEFLTLKQWFIKILDHKADFLEIADKINWYPSFMKARYRDWVSNLSWDWCISRQKFYGIAFPVWHCNNCDEVLLARKEDLPIDPQETPYPGEKCTKCSSTDIRPETDVMDTWNTSSLTPQVNVKWPKSPSDRPKMPMSLRPQAHDIIRTWAFYTIVKSFYHNGDMPWSDIVISGHVLDGKEKVSKSKGGAKLTPEKLLETYPADVIRYWSASGKLGTDTAFSENQLKIGGKLLTKLWNAYRFCGDHLSGYERPETAPKLDNLSSWLLHKLSETTRRYTSAFDQYDYAKALESVEHLFWHVFCDNYLELVKDQFFKPENYDQETIDGTRFALHEICFGLLQLFAPFIPHITEKLYGLFFAKKGACASLHATTLDTKRLGSFDAPESLKAMELVLEIIGQIRKLKSDNAMSLKTELSSLHVYSAEPARLNIIEGEKRMICGISNAQDIEFLEGEIEKPEIWKTDAGLQASITI
jgi:valyl-tRNA synthetase